MTEAELCLELARELDRVRTTYLQRAEAAEARVKELETTRDTYLAGHVASLEAERDELKTRLDDTALVADRWMARARTWKACAKRFRKDAWTADRLWRGAILRAEHAERLRDPRGD